MGVKTFSLISGHEEGWYWRITMRVYPNGTFWNKKGFYFEESLKALFRVKDRSYFVYHFGKDYMRGKEVHHEWDNNAAPRVLSKAAHKEVHRVAC